MSVSGPPGFPAMLRRLRQQAGLSQNRLARASGIDPAYVNRMEAASEQAPIVPRPVVLGRLCDALGLARLERDRLYVAAGRCPPTLQALGGWDPALAALAEALADDALGDDDRAELRQVIAVLAERWRQSAQRRV